MSTWRDIKSIDINSFGIKSLWAPTVDKQLIIYNIEIFGYCSASIGQPFILNIEAKMDNVWNKLCGIKSISNKEFIQSYCYISGLKMDKGDGVNSVLRVVTTGSNKLDFTVSIIGIEL